MGNCFSVERNTQPGDISIPEIPAANRSNVGIGNPVQPVDQILNRTPDGGVLADRPPFPGIRLNHLV